MDARKLGFIIFLTKMCFGGSEEIHEDTAERHLYSYLFESNYDACVRPVANVDDPINVTVRFELSQITKIDDKEQTMYTSGFFVAFWKDEYLKWEPAKFSGIENFVVAATLAWLPDFALINSVTGIYDKTHKELFKVHIRYDGTVYWIYGGIFATRCELDLTYFPYDKQICKLVIENWAYTQEQVNLLHDIDYVPLDNFHENGEWILDKTKVHPEEFHHDIYPTSIFPGLAFELFITRKPGYYNVNILFPCMLIVSLALAMFWMPAEAGEKVSLGITVMLAFSVFQLVIAEQTPKTSEFYPVLVIYVAFIMSVSAVSTATAIIVLYLNYHPSTNRPPKIIRQICFEYLAKFLFMYRLVPHDNENYHKISASPAGKFGNVMMLNTLSTPSGKEYNDTRRYTDNQGLKEITDEVKVITKHIKDQKKESDIQGEWKALARVFDRFFFWICLLIVICSCLAMFVPQDEEY